MIPRSDFRQFIIVCFPFGLARYHFWYSGFGLPLIRDGGATANKSWLEQLPPSVFSVSDFGFIVVNVDWSRPRGG